MSLYGMMRTGASGMAAQASRLSAVSDNISNANTTGYKTASTEFSSLLLPSISGNYNSGGVQTEIRHAISQQGSLDYTSSNTDLAINGNGFFVVQNASGTPYLTRAGAFTPNADGELVNAGGYTLLGYPYTDGDPTPVVNGFDGLEPVTVGANKLTASASTAGVFSANLDSSADIITSTDTPGSSTVVAGTVFTQGSEYTSKSSLKGYDSLGNTVLYDIYYTKTADNTWEVAVYNQADANGDGSYNTTALATGTLDFYNGGTAQDGTLDIGSSTNLDADGKLTVLSGGAGTNSGDSVANMGDLTIDLSGMTQYSYDFSVQSATVDGNAPSQVTGVQITSDGIVYAQYDNGDLNPLYRVAMANVESPDQLNVISGNVYQASNDSGVTVLGFAENSGFGSIVSGALESSNVDLASELTTMISAQRSYTADSKVFQTGSDLMDVLVNLKR
jgi:flagellar hook protein FlgE